MRIVNGILAAIITVGLVLFIVIFSDWLNKNDGTIIAIATVVLVCITGCYTYLTWSMLKAKTTKDIQKDLRHMSTGLYKPVVRTQPLSHEDFKATLERLDVLAKKFAKPNVQPLSDCAMNRESIYQDHPKL